MAQRTVLRATALFGALAVAMAGCGGGDTTRTPAQGPASASPGGEEMRTRSSQGQ